MDHVRLEASDVQDRWPHRESASPPILFQSLRASGPEGIAFDSWYGNQVLPAIRAQTGVAKVRRYACPSRSLYMTISELADGAVDRAAPTLPSGNRPASLSHYEAFVGLPLSTRHRIDVDERAMDAPIAYQVFFQVPLDRHDAFDRWYDEEHVPMVLQCPYWAMTRRFRVGPSAGMSWTHAALHYLTDFRALASPERDQARSTSWRKRLDAEGWLKGEYQVFQRVCG